METATEWLQIWGKLAFEGLELQRRLFAGATPSETPDTPAPTRPKARSACGGREASGMKGPPTPERSLSGASVRGRPDVAY